MESLFHESYPDTMKMSCHPLPMHLKLTLVPTVQQRVSYMKYPYKILSSGRREIAIAVSNWLLSKLNGKKKTTLQCMQDFFKAYRFDGLFLPRLVFHYQIWSMAQLLCHYSFLQHQLQVHEWLCSLFSTGIQHCVLEETYSPQYFHRIVCKIPLIICFLEYVICADFWTDCPSHLGLPDLAQLKAGR